MRLDHVQIAIPIGGENEARAYFADLLGLTEIPKPLALQGRGGCWFKLGDSALHLGADPGFVPARKAHVALAFANLDAVRNVLTRAGYEISDAAPFDERPRFFSTDPFGNRLEFLEG